MSGDATTFWRPDIASESNTHGDTAVIEFGWGMDDWLGKVKDNPWRFSDLVRPEGLSEGPPELIFEYPIGDVFRPIRRALCLWILECKALLQYLDVSGDAAFVTQQQHNAEIMLQKLKNITKNKGNKDYEGEDWSKGEKEFVATYKTPEAQQWREKLVEAVAIIRAAVEAGDRER